MKKTLPNTLTEEELLEAAKNGEQSESYSDDVLGFMSFYKISSGTHWVKAKVLYKLYRNWCTKPKKYAVFCGELSHYVDNEYLCRKGKFFLINFSALEIGNKTIQSLDDEVDKTKLPKYKKHFEYFLEKFNISSGSIWVESFVVYALYDKWVYENYKNWNPIGRNQLHNFLKLYFEHKRVTDSRMIWYRLNDSFIKDNFTPESISRIRKGYYEKQTKRAKKANSTKIKKIKRKISSGKT
jgi:hypothetical protein